MYQISLINAVRSWERGLETKNKQHHHDRESRLQPVYKNFSTGVQPVAESETTMYHTSLINAVQVWQRRLEIEEQHRKQRLARAQTVHETIFRRLPRFKLGHAEKLDPKVETISCCQVQVDLQDVLRP